MMRKWTWGSWQRIEYINSVLKRIDMVDIADDR